MALDRLTKVDGGGISTTSDYRVGIITASKFVGPFDGTGGNFSGVITATDGVFSGNISAVDGNFSGNVTIGGTLTYEDVTNIDSVGLVTARDGIFIPDNKELKIGNTAGSPDTKIFHNGSKTRLVSTVQYDMDADIIDIHNASANAMKARFLNNQVELYYANNKKFETRSNGINVTGRIFCDGALANNRGLIFNDNVKISLGSSNDLEIFHDGSNSKIVDGGTGSLLLLSDSFKVQNAAGTENQIIANENGAVDLYFDNNLRLSSENYGVNIFGQSTAVTFNLYTAGGGKRGGLYATNGNVISLRDGQDHNILRGVKDGAAELYYDNVKKFETTSNGAAVSNIQNNQGLDLNGVGNNTCIRFMSTGSSPGHAFRIAYHSLTNYLYGSPALTFDKTDTSGNFDSHIAGISDGGFHLADNKKLHLGNKLSASGDLQIYHDGSHSYIDDTGTGNLYIQSNHVNIDSKNGEQFIDCIQDGAVELYHNGTKKAETSTQGLLIPNTLGVSFGDAGCKVTGTAGSGASAGLFFMTNSSNKWQITGDGHLLPKTAVGGVDIGSASAEIGNVYIADNKKAYFGSDQDFQVSHNGTHAVVKETTGRLYVLSDNLWFKNQADNSTTARFLNGDSVLLYYAGNLKLQTLSNGINVTGKVIASGEIEAAQDYPNIRPTLDFNFAATKKLRPEMTFARAGEASFHDGVGSVKFVSDNEPRFEHDIITGECKGLMFEGAGTNYSWHSRQFYSSGYPANSWVPINGGATPTITENTHTAPDGTSSGVYMADTITGATGTTVSGNVVRQQWTSGTSVKHTVSIYVKLLTATQATIYLRDANTGSTQTASAVNIKGWQRLVVTSSSAMTASVNHSWFIGNTNGTIAVWGSQIERSDYVSSYIKTTGGANGTRNADAGVQLDGEDFTDAFNEGKGTLIAEAIPTLSLSNQVIVGLHQDLGNNNRVEVRSMGNNTANARFEVVVSGSSVVFNNSLPHSGINNVSKYAFAVEKDNYAMCVNGSTVATDTSGAFPPGINSMIIGDSSYGVDSSMIIKRIMYYSDRIPNSQLVTLTS